MSAATDLRHMTSNTTLASPRMSQLLRPHSPARSPTSIPSSPTSVHSSSSAIFERDIEPLSPPSPQHHSTNAHRIPRSKATEQIEHSVPSVLDSAAAILASIQNTNDIAIVSPAPFAGSGFASPIGSFRSRSPSPTIGSLTAHGRNSLLLSIPQQQQQGLMASPPTVRCPPIQTTQSPPAIVTPTSAYFSVADGSDMGQPSESAQDEIPATPPPAAPSSLPALSSSPASTHIPSQPHSPLSAPNAASKRLSFISYADLLTSTPTSTLPLSSLTTAASTSEPPPHITGVSVAASHPGSAGTSLRGFAMGPHDAFGPTAANTGSQSGSPKAKRDSIALGLMGPGHPAAVDDVGGEWEREGLGRGLAERLDVLYGTANT
ncbi:hypothetical protein D9615_009250 [Tricholomella constricta]|uniref:Uncharacterized protein n=1 Tax=Tricholomella constricta TaxID=117010 RepID=A0A8H5GWN8_9AGAR|nr:hypothetical protein D9615_009250 [Tricholomella constricta]